MKRRRFIISTLLGLASTFIPFAKGPSKPPCRVERFAFVQGSPPKVPRPNLKPGEYCSRQEIKVPAPRLLSTGQLLYSVECKYTIQTL